MSVCLIVISVTSDRVGAQEGKQVVDIDLATEIIPSHVHHPVADEFLKKALDVYHELKDLFEARHQQSSSSLSNEYIRDEFEFWISCFGNYDSKKCTVKFETSLLDRRRHLIKVTLADTGSDAPIVTPNLDQFIALQRESYWRSARMI